MSWRNSPSSWRRRTTWCSARTRACRRRWSRPRATFLEQTDAYWREYSRALAIPYEWQDAVIRAAITLKLCSYEETGGIVAAITTSIPEAPGSERNWDYRYCWLRDAYFVVHALNRLGTTKTMEDYLSYITNIVAGRDDRASCSRCSA